MSVPWSACVDQSTTCRHQVSPSTVCVPGSKLTTSAFVLSTFACWAVSPAPQTTSSSFILSQWLELLWAQFLVLGTQLTMASVLAHLPCRSTIGWCEDHLARKSRQAPPTSVTVSISSRVNQEQSVARVPWVTALSVPLRRRISKTSLERGNFAKGRTQAGYPSSPNLSISPYLPG